MKKILVLGAGRSSSSLIHYLLNHAEKLGWEVSVADMNLELASKHLKNYSHGRAIAMDVTDVDQLKQEISSTDLVVSLLPPSFHILAAKECVHSKKSMVTASYVSPELAQLDQQAKQAGVLLLNECGLDPGIDHMSAMKIINDAREKGENVYSFRSYCGGLVAPEYNTNPWGYKFTWNPRNVVLAGQGGDAHFLKNGEEKRTPYERLFLETETIHVAELGDFEAYANRDSLSYISSYGFTNIHELLRGTLRMPGFCEAWNELIQLGLTNDSIILKEDLSWNELILLLNPESSSIHESSETVRSKLQWLGIFSDQKIPRSAKTPAQALQMLLQEKWYLEKEDKDMIVMQHEFIFTKKDKKRKVISSMVVKGKDQENTAMAMTVGLPLAICAKFILEGKIKSIGVAIPVVPEIYEATLRELETLGIRFTEKEVEM